ncbi:MAG: sulfur carrier protein ThiS [Pseudobutyrivibrio sp.]|nr:sulfur carrier protein ThiS [Pseudobutyrivibrio sp.]
MVFINGEEYQYVNANLSDVLKELNYKKETIAVEINEEIVPKATFDETILKDGDVVEVVSFVGGG